MWSFLTTLELVDKVVQGKIALVNKLLICHGASNSTPQSFYTIPRLIKICCGDLGSMHPLLRHTLSNWKGCFTSGSCIGVANHTFFKNLALKKKIYIHSSYNAEKEPLVPSDLQLATAKVIYSIAPAVGHNQESHPESNLRVPAIASALEQMELSPKYRCSEIIELKHFKPASTEDVISVHERAYVLGLEKAMEKASEQGLIFIEGSGPTYATSSTFQDSLIAAGAGLAVVDSVVAASRNSADPPAGFALIRPPGHHAVPKGPMGFCVFGNIAIAARYAQREHGLKRVFIIDFDVHHGNGTHDAFYEDPDIFFLSTHQDGSYPGTGKIHEVGRGQGEGTSLNLPLPGGSGDIAMRTVFDEVIVPCAQKFKPDIILVSAGAYCSYTLQPLHKSGFVKRLAKLNLQIALSFDGHVLDPLASLQFTTGTYYVLAANIKQLAKELCGGRCVFFLEGGYNLKSLSYSVADTFRALLGDTSRASEFDNPGILYEEPSTRIKEAIQKAKAIHSL